MTAGARQPARDRQQLTLAGVGGLDGRCGQADQGCPAGEVVRQGGHHGPCAVGVKAAGGEVTECLVFEVADHQLDRGVVAVIDIGNECRDGAVGRERVVAPVGEQLGLRADEAGAAHDQPEAPELRFGDLRLPGVGIVRHPGPVGLGDLVDQCPDLLALLDADRELDALAVERLHQLVVLKPGVRPQHDQAGMAGAAHAREQLVHESLGAALRVGLALAVADVQHLAGIGAGGDDRVISVDARVPVGGALLLIPVDLADEAVQIDHQRPIARTRASPPRPPERDIQDAVELTDVPEGERAQERPERRGCHHPVPEDQTGRTGPQHVHLIDAVRPGDHPVHQRHDLAARQRRARSARVKPHRLVHRLLDPEPLGEGRRDQQPGVADQPLIVELDPHRIETRRPGRNVRCSVHHMGDLLTGPQPPHTTATKALLRRTLRLRPGRNQPRYSVVPGLDSVLALPSKLMYCAIFGKAVGSLYRAEHPPRLPGVGAELTAKGPPLAKDAVTWLRIVSPQSPLAMV